jgi:hypothetical protein
MKNKDIISLSFIYYDMQIKKYKKYYNKNNKLILKYYNDEATFEIKNDTKILMTGNFNYIGRFNNNQKIFKWGWDFTYINNKNEFIKNNTYYIKKIMNYIFDINIKGNNIEENIEDIIYYNDIKDIFLHNKNTIEYPLQLEQLLAITLYITKSDLIYKKDLIDQKNTDYYILRNVKIL